MSVHRRQRLAHVVKVAFTAALFGLTPVIDAIVALISSNVLHADVGRPRAR